MPPKRRRREETVSDSGSDVVFLHRPTATTLLPEVMQNIEQLKTKRARGRKKITEQFDAYAAKKKKDIDSHYASRAEQRSSEAKDLLTRYAEALEKRASIEKSIEEIVLNARENLRELSIVLGAAYSGRQRQTGSAIGSFASTTLTSPKGAAAPAAVADSGSVPEKRGLDMQSKSHIDRNEEHTHAGNPAFARGVKTQYGKRRRESVFDRILW
ncbi:hypothetical protein GGS21DRAFT_61433 [Xylaria nigripes]|nr:hypothetical protein GGS21DRAFT_61433 [Xylaria nigripes]